MIDTSTLCLLVENQPGVLGRIVGQVTRRRINIEFLTADATDTGEHSRITMILAADDSTVAKLTKQITRQVHVIDAKQESTTSARVGIREGVNAVVTLTTSDRSGSSPSDVPAQLASTRTTQSQETINPTDELSAETVLRAANRLRHVVRQTPLEPSPRLTTQIGVPVLLKREDLQLGRSYKVRGAYNLIASLTSDERQRGIVCASAGNHGQGVALSCSALNIRGRVYLPANTPRQKRERIAALGGDWIETVIAGTFFDEANLAAHRDSERTDAVYVHPFDDPRTIAGQGTVAIETTQQHQDGIDTVIVPVGGGGLIAGVLLWIKQHLPDVHVIGAEPAGAASMHAALTNGGPTSLPHIDTFVDGAAVARVGRLGYQVARSLLDELVAVPEGAVCTEMIDLYQTEGIIAEPAGALASAAARMPLRRTPDGPIVCVVSGGNNDISRYGEVIERSREPTGRCAWPTLPSGARLRSLRLSGP